MIFKNIKYIDPSLYGISTGDGSSYSEPLGGLPSSIDSDILFIIRKHTQSYPLYLNAIALNGFSFGICGCPDSGDEILSDLPSEVLSCPWVAESGSVVLLQNNSSQITGQAKVFSLRNMEIIKNSAGTIANYVIDISSDNQSNPGFLDIENCRISSSGANIDTGTSWDSACCRYLRWQGYLSRMRVSNCTINFSNSTYDAFRIQRCEKAIIQDINIFSTSTSAESWNGFCFSFVYSDFENVASASTYQTYVKRLVMSNVLMNVKLSTNVSIPGIVCSANCYCANINHIRYTTGKTIGTPTSSPVSRNGAIFLSGLVNYFINDIEVRMEDSAYIPYHGPIDIRVQDIPSSQIAETTNINRIISNINIIMSNRTDSANSQYQREYLTTTTDFYLYSAFSFIRIAGSSSEINPSTMVNLARAIYVYAPMSRAVSLKNTKMVQGKVTGCVSLCGASAELEEIVTDLGYNAIGIATQGEAYIDKITVNNYNYGEVVRLSNAYNGSVVVGECNVPLNSIGYGAATTYGNDFVVYCPNTYGYGGIFLKGMANTVLPAQMKRMNGSPRSLRLCKFNESVTPFAVPPIPHVGWPIFLTDGNHKLTIFFSHGENVEYTEFIKQNLTIEVSVGGKIYDSRVDGSWLEDDSEWSEVLLSKFKYELPFSVSGNGNASVRVYYNMWTSSNGGLFLDPLFLWE